MSESDSGIVVTLTIPVRTVSEANARGSWKGRWRRSRAQRLAAYTLFRGALLPASPWVVTLIRIAPRELDDDNLRGALKAIRDEATDWLGLPNDRHPLVRWEYGQRKGKPGEYAVLVRVANCLKTAPGLPVAERTGSERGAGH